MSEKVTKKFINKVLKEWQEKLNLKHWTIQVVIKDAEELDGKVLGGSIEILSGRNFARLILTSITLNGGRKTVESTIIHELLHLLSNQIKIHLEVLLGRCSADVLDAVSAIVYDDIENITDSFTTICLKLDGKGDLEYISGEAEAVGTDIIFENDKGEVMPWEND